MKNTRSAPKRLYIDTNIYLDHFLGRLGRSTDLMHEIAKGTFNGVTSHFTFSEMAGVLKMAGVARQKINSILISAQRFPNIQIVFHDPNMFQVLPNEILNACVQARDALHFIIALRLKVDHIITRDIGFRNAVSTIIPCNTPEDILL